MTGQAARTRIQRRDGTGGQGLAIEYGFGHDTLLTYCQVLRYPDTVQRLATI